MVKTFVPLDSKKCLQCAYLMLTETKFQDDCPTLSTSGCPALHFQIGVGMNIQKASDAIAEALYTKDVARLKRCVDRLAGSDPKDSEQVLDLVFDKTAALYGIEIGNTDDADSGPSDDDKDEDTDLVPTGEATVSLTASNAPTAVQVPKAAETHSDEDEDLVPSAKSPQHVAAAIVQDETPNVVVVAPIANASSVVDAAATADGGDDEWSDNGQP